MYGFWINNLLIIQKKSCWRKKLRLLDVGNFPKQTHTLLIKLCTQGPELAAPNANTQKSGLANHEPYDDPTLPTSLSIISKSQRAFTTKAVRTSTLTLVTRIKTVFKSIRQTQCISRPSQWSGNMKKERNGF